MRVVELRRATDDYGPCPLTWGRIAGPSSPRFQLSMAGLNNLNRALKSLPNLTRSVSSTTPQSAVRTAVSVGPPAVLEEHRLTACSSLGSLLHGSQDARKEGEQLLQQHSRIVGRGVSAFSSSEVGNGRRGMGWDFAGEDEEQPQGATGRTLADCCSRIPAEICARVPE